jgi:hypothetical protein
MLQVPVPTLAKASWHNALEEPKESTCPSLVPVTDPLSAGTAWVVVDPGMVVELPSGFVQVTEEIVTVSVLAPVVKVPKKVPGLSTGLLPAEVTNCAGAVSVACAVCAEQPPVAEAVAVAVTCTVPV